MTTPDHAKAQDALRAAQLYYLQDLTMDAIAHELRTSRSSVSRLLSFARETGLVEITVHSPQDARSSVEREIGERFGVRAHVVPVPDRISEVERLERVARSAARILATMVDSNMTVSIAWGATLSAIGRHLPAKPTHNTHVVQMNGAANFRTTGIPYAGEILSRFGAAFGAEVHQFPVPALFDDPATKRAMWRERSVRSVLELQERTSIFVFGLGAPGAAVPSHVYSGDYFDEQDVALMRARGVVGDCATVFYREDGTSEGIELNERSSGPSIAAVRRIPGRFCVVAGNSKLHSLRGALAAGVATELVIDEPLGRDLVG